ncbi:MULTISPECIES: cytochrome c oxidase subunit II [Pseudanabaena]|uniref:Cytochrome c oxidase subunit 2 n=2 Tax=Pseudanabaena TaxID=1152 RepID=L8MV41_9CYAN|nr:MULTISPECIES: cytochrome c oxidase subunit II [Pseudanabaena]ELS30679.1 cytochrome c oxidase subunit II [Pseudanabaena biceps PCC 7429]MDG3497050.1 cytochrome c oxidase subunit II [Pseudanabaena catenata USMAC16]
MKLRTILTLVGVAIAIALISLWMGQSAYTWFPPQASAESILVDNLFSFLVTLGTFIFLGVVGTLTYSILFQRAGKYDYSDGPHIEGNVKLEIIWTAIPFALVIWIAAYSYQIYDQMSILGPMEHAHHGAMMAVADAAEVHESQLEEVEQIQVLARQWSWEFRYGNGTGNGTGNVSSTELHLPNNRRIKLVLHSEDVLHGLYIPAFRVKQDVIPGRDIDFEFTPIREGKYRLRDSQYSGTYFAAMQTDVVVESPEAYQKWLADASIATPVVAYNRASNEYAKRDNANNLVTVIPAAPPVVNYSN